MRDRFLIALFHFGNPFGMRPFRSMVVSFQVDSFQVKVIPFHNIVDSFHAIVDSFHSRNNLKRIIQLTSRLRTLCQTCPSP